MKTLLSDRADISQLLQELEDSYNHRDVNRLLKAWPSFPLAVLQSVFKDKQAGTASFSAKGTPDVKGEMASLSVVIKKSDSTKVVPFNFKKQNDHWVIDKGSL